MRKGAPNRKRSMAFPALKNKPALAGAEGRMGSEGTKPWLPVRLPDPGTLAGIPLALHDSLAGRRDWSEQYNLGEEA
jgi:hypothetical protein